MISSETTMSPEAFQTAVMRRDQSRCVICAEAARLAHPIMDIGLWDDGGGLVLSNGAVLCRRHQEAALATLLSVEELCAACGIAEPHLPPQLYAVQPYDRWGNPVLSGGRRARGELFFEPEVQLWLRRGHMLERFAEWVKYPRTYVLPWSDSIGAGDRRTASLEPFAGQRVIVTEKMDGENVTLYRDFLHTRTVARIHHPSREWLDRFWSGIREAIPPGWRICGEYLYVTHTVRYDQLPSFFMGFSVWDQTNTCLAWDDSSAFLGAAGITPVPVAYDGIFDPEQIHKAWSQSVRPDSEGYIVRTAGPISYRDFRHRTGKYIRPGYEQSEPVHNNVRFGAALKQNGLA